MTDKIVFIKYKQKINDTHINALVAEGAEVLHVYKNINWISVKVPNENVERLKSHTDVEIIEDDHQARILISDYQLIPALTGQIIPWGVSKVRAPDVWQEGNKGTGIKWCIIDTGVNRNHPDLAANIQGGYNYVSNNDNFEDDHGHGTHVSGIIAALDNDIGVVGVAPEAGIYAYKVLDNNGSGYYSNIVRAIDDAITNGMQGINMSLGGLVFSQALKDACAAAYAAGIVIVAAAGNSDGDGTQDTVSYPAKFSDYVIAIAATDITDNRAIFSSCGTEVEDSAPGDGIISTVPQSGGELTDPSGYMSASGTSMAAPHVSGACALIIKKHPEFKPSDVRAALDGTAVHLGDPGKNLFYGNGRIDAKAAVDNIPQPPPPPPEVKKFRVQPIGIPGHMIGVTVTKWPFGADKTGEEACKEVCDLLKTM